MGVRAHGDVFDESVRTEGVNLTNWWVGGIGDSISE
jgi:hypothetical protein